MTPVTYPLSALAKARLKRNNMISLLCVVLTIATAIITSQLWVGFGTLYFLAKFYFRVRILVLADPHLTMSADGLTHHWSRETFIPWDDMIDVADGGKYVISLRYRLKGAEKPAVLKIYKWRLEGDPATLMDEIENRRFNKNPATLP